jgi:hypothetical protein
MVKNDEFSWSLVYIKGPLTPYEPIVSHSQPEDIHDSIQLTRSGKEQHQDNSINGSTPII